jgi:hypothetical protein
MPDDPENFQLAFFSALRGLRHLYFKLEKSEVNLHSQCSECVEIKNFMNVPRYRGRGVQPEDWQGAFSRALAGLKHLYFRLEEAKLDLHSACDGCYEIRNFMNTPNYLGNREDLVGVEYYRPLTEYDNDYATAVAADKDLMHKLPRTSDKP